MPEGAAPRCKQQLKLIDGQCYQIYCNFYNSGDVIGTTTTKNVLACTKYCRTVTNCIYAVFNRKTGECDVLDSTTGGDTKNKGYDLGELQFSPSVCNG